MNTYLIPTTAAYCYEPYDHIYLVYANSNQEAYENACKNLQGGHGQHRLRSEGTGTGRVHSPQSPPGQQGQDRGCGVCHLRDTPSPGHGPAV